MTIALLKTPFTAATLRTLPLLSLMASVLLTGCASNTLKQPAKTVTINAMTQLYSSAGFSFNTTGQVTDISFVDKSKDANTVNPNAPASTQEALRLLTEQHIQQASKAGDSADYWAENARKATDEAAKAASLTAADNSPAEQALEQCSAEDNVDCNEEYGYDSENPNDVHSVKPKADYLAALSSLAGWLNKAVSQSSYSTSGTVDFKNKRIELTPRIAYTSKNAASFRQAPMVIDLNQNQVFFDENPLSMLFINSKYQGKITNVSLQPLLDKADIYGLLKELRSTLLATYQQLPDTAFSHAPLSDADKKLGAKDKIVLSLGANDFNIALVDNVYKHRDLILSHLKTDAAAKQNLSMMATTLAVQAPELPSTESQNPNPNSPSVNLTDKAALASSETPIANNQTDKSLSEKLHTLSAKLFDQATSKSQVAFVLDGAGKILHIDRTMQLHSPVDLPFSYQLSTVSKTHISYTLAAPTLLPTSTNTIPFSEATKDSFFDLSLKQYTRKKSSHFTD